MDVKANFKIQNIALRAEEILESITDAFYAVDADWRLIYINRRCEQWWGRNREELLGAVLWDMLPNYETTQGYREHVRAMVERRTVHFETRSPNLHSWVEVSIYPAADGGLSIYFRDVSVRKQMEELLLRQSEDRFQRIFQKSPDIIKIIRMTDDRYIDVNQAFIDILGYSRDEVIGRTPAELNIMANDKTYIISLYKDFNQKGKLQNFPVNCRAKSGAILHMLCSMNHINLGGEECRLTILKDITKEKQLAIELQRLDRLNIAGEMAVAIGHEVRNPMTTVRGYLQMFQNKQEYVAQREKFSIMIEEVDRANTIISDFLSLAKNKAVKMKKNNLNAIILALAPLIQTNALHTGHQLNIQIGDVPDFHLDEKEIRQLILNLTDNAFEAMNPGGKLTIATNCENEKVALSIRDKGGGIPPQVLDKLGAPFLTTKDNGTGLGLAVCYRIAERHCAKIDVQTSSEGTTFIISFQVENK